MQVVPASDIENADESIKAAIEGCADREIIKADLSREIWRVQELMEYFDIAKSTAYKLAQKPDFPNQLKHVKGRWRASECRAYGR